tara:strand:- start:7418 stop:7987 length:570 start_codon:yes stop_codon:yes gene_type:complete
MPLSCQQIEQNQHFISALAICNIIHTSFTVFKEKIKILNSQNTNKKISLSNDARFLDDTILSVIGLLDRLLVVHETYQQTHDSDWIKKQISTMSAALRYSSEQLNLVMDTTKNEIQTGMKKKELPALVEALSGLTSLLKKTYFYDGVFILDKIFTPLASVFSGHFPPTISAEKTQTIELDFIEKKDLRS